MTQSNSKPDIFIYKMTADNGGAPCIHNGIISLCICKPDIRTNRSADKGDWIIGMGGKSVSDLKGRLIYIMQVKECVDGNLYYAPGSKYADRPDCIYEWDGNEYIWKEGAEYHKNGEQLTHDLGTSPNYDKAVCLVGDKFAYFGNGKKVDPSIKNIEDIYNALPRNYRKNYDTADYKLLIDYIKDYIMTKYEGMNGTPTHSDKDKKCNESEGGGCTITCG